MEEENKKQFKTSLIMVGITVLIILIVVLIFLIRKPEIADEETAICIGNHSILYFSKTCTHCVQQEAMFGENVKFLTSIDCLDFPSTCLDQGIDSVPTWIINDKRYPGIHSIRELRNLTGC